MSYRFDPDLEFLGTLPSQKLENLVEIITDSKSGYERLTENLSTSEAYKRYYPAHREYWREIASEIQTFGGNTFANLFRGGKGVLYKEILIDVCERLKVNFNPKNEVTLIETHLLQKLIEKTIENMTKEDKENLAKNMGIFNPGLSGSPLSAALLKGFQAGGFSSYQYALKIVNALSKIFFQRGLSFAANAALTKYLSILMGPVGWGVTGVWAAFDIASPAYRVTIPAVVQVALLRGNK